MELGLNGHGVLVTGASGGIGTAIARTLAAEGVRVAVHYNAGHQRAEALASEIGGVALQADLRDEAAVDALIPAALDALGRLDACVANAGVYHADSVPVASMPLSRWRETIDGNLTASFLTARAYLSHVERTGTGSLVFVTAAAGLFGEAGHADYAAAKSAVTAGLALSLKNEIVRRAPQGRVNVVAPGPTYTPMTSPFLTDAVVAQVTSTAALRRIAEADDVARAVTWLCSPLAAGHVTGEVLSVTGGLEGRLLHPPS